LSREMHHEEQSDSDVESELDDNTTPYHQLELERRAKVVPTEVSYNTLCFQVFEDVNKCTIHF
ncbi:hypothetical protein Tco_0515896, partial [Tanacetum coccineum]